jgi:nicotinamidase/pyrazinamidase
MIFSLLGIIDAQIDFMSDSGSLFVKGADLIRGYLGNAVNKAVSLGMDLFFTMDQHLESDLEFKKNGGLFPDHCIFGSEGQMVIPELSLHLTGSIVFPKRCVNVFDTSLGNVYAEPFIRMRPESHVYLIGVVGNICVEAAALGIRGMGKDVTIIENCTAWLDIDDTCCEEASRKRMLSAGVKFLHSYEYIV